MSNSVSIVTNTTALVLFLLVVLVLRCTTAIATASSLAVRTGHRHRQSPPTTATTNLLLSPRRRRTVSSATTTATTSSDTATTGAATRAVSRVRVHLGTPHRQRQRQRQRQQLRQRWRLQRKHDLLLATGSRDDVGHNQPGYGYTDQRCEDESSCIAPRECIFVGNKVCSDKLNICSCKLAFDRQLCRSSADCLPGDRCYQFAALLERRCVSCSLKGTVYVKNEVFRPMDNGWTCIDADETDTPSTMNGDNASPSETPGVMGSTNNSSGSGGNSTSMMPSASASPTVRVTSNSSLVPGLIGGISVAVVVPTLIILVICFKMSHSS